MSLVDEANNNINNNNEEPMCRMTRYGEMNRIDYNMASCAQCYDYLSLVFANFEPKLMIDESDRRYLLDFNASRFNASSARDRELIRTGMNSGEYEKWRDCCDEASNCCSNVMQTSIPMENTCPSIWDGWSCHYQTMSGKESVVKCPEYHVADTCHSILDYVHFKCDQNGSWFKNEENTEWADYTRCLLPLFEMKERMISLNIVCHFVSLVFLIIGLVIFFSYRKLNVNRITLHKHFFVSLILNSALQIVWESVFMRQSLSDHSTFIESNQISCIIFNVLMQYARCTNYFWMFNESFYLLKLLVKVFNDQANMHLHFFIGWGMPFIICFIFSICSYFYGNYGCWTQNIRLNYIFIIPNISILIVNLAFLLAILTILCKALNVQNKNEVNQYQRTLKATFILVPLFGIHYLLSPIVICDSAPYSELYNVIVRLVENLQGFMVALLYCFMNNEVKYLLKKTVKSKSFKFLKLSETSEMPMTTTGDLNTESFNLKSIKD